MEIKIVEMEILAREPFEQTANPKIHIQPNTGTILIIEGEIVYRISTT
jgi:hypothetical protein